MIQTLLIDQVILVMLEIYIVVKISLRIPYSFIKFRTGLYIPRETLKLFY